MNYITDSGYGNCLKTHENGPICFVKEPTTCGDVVNADSRGPTGYSWEACKQGHI